MNTIHSLLVASMLSIVVPACGGTPSTEDAPASSSSEALSGVTGPAFYVDGVLYRTVGTPTDFPLSAPDDSFETIWAFGGVQAHNVALAGPGQPGFKGGRWMVHGLSFTNYATALARHDMDGSGDFDSDEEVTAALASGDATDIGLLKAFECPVIPVAQNP